MSEDHEKGEIVTDIVPRSSIPLDNEGFQKALTLHNRHPWLVARSQAFIELWNSCFSIDEQDLVYSLIDRFTFMDSTMQTQALADLKTHIQDVWKVDSRQRVLIVAVSDCSQADGSQAILQSLKNKFRNSDGWSERNFYNSYTSGLDAVQNRDVVVLLDDFVGTGRTIMRKFSAFKQTLIDRGLDHVNLKACSVAAMKFSFKVLQQEGVDFFAPVLLDKGITEFFKGEELEKAINLMDALEKRLTKRVRHLRLVDHSFGFGKSETLFCLTDNNVPNNVFPIFWWEKAVDDQIRNTMFYRLRS